MTTDKQIVELYNGKLMSYDAGEHLLISPKSTLVDNWEPNTEQILLKSASTKEGRIKISTTNYPSKITVNKHKDPASRLLSRTKDMSNSYIADMRINFPDNWAHAITNHLPLCYLISGILSKKGIFNCKFLFPRKMSAKLKSLFMLSGIDSIYYDNVITATPVIFHIEPWISIRGIRHKIICDNIVNTNLYFNIKNSKYKFNKIFISRKDTRRLSNENEIEKLLQKRGYEKIYLEDLPLEDQFSCVVFASEIVAIHGAGLAPLIFRSAFRASGGKLIELFSPGHITNVYRILAHQAGMKWLGVRGKIWRSMIPFIYMENINHHKFAYDDFEVDINSLEEALTI